MTDLFAHSGKIVNAEHRYLRRDMSANTCYLSAMRLRLKELRKKKGWTVQQLADAVGLSKSYVSDLENGKRRANSYRLEKFANAFGVNVYELLDDGSMSDEERTLLLDFGSMSQQSREIILSTARAFREKDEAD